MLQITWNRDAWDLMDARADKSSKTWGIGDIANRLWTREPMWIS